MCEILYINRAESFYLSEVLPIATEIEKYGIAGFGWGIS